MQKRVKSVSVFLVIVLATVLISSITSAGIFDWFNKITGKASSQPTTVSIGVTGINAVTISVWNQTMTGMLPTEASSMTINFNVTVSDLDGAADINTSSVQAVFTRAGETSRSNSSCAYTSGQDGTNSRNFSCTITMWYWDGIGAWNINVTANDIGNLTAQSNTTMKFSFGQLQAIVISPSALTWAALVTGAVNQTSNNDPTTINNTGNYDVASGNVQVNGINLRVVTYNTYSLNAGNFSVDIETGSSAECTNGTTLVNGTDTGITSSILAGGNLSAGGGTAQEDLYYCIPSVPNIPSQTYSTAGAGSWTIKII